MLQAQLHLSGIKKGISPPPSEDCSAGGVGVATAENEQAPASVNAPSAICY